MYSQTTYPQNIFNTFPHQQPQLNLNNPDSLQQPQLNLINPPSIQQPQQPPQQPQLQYQQQHRNPSNQIDLTTHSPYIPRPQRNPTPQIDIEDSEVFVIPRT